MTLATLLPSYLQIHHCAGKLAGAEIGLYQLDDEPDAFAVVVMLGADIRRTPIMAEAKARASYWELVSDYNALSVSA